MYSRLFHNRSFMALWIGQMVSFIGDYFNLLAIPILINRLTGSAAMVGLSFISNALPALVLGPIAGVFVDRLDRRKVMIASDLIRAVLVLGLLAVRDARHVWILYVVGFLVSCTSQFFFPARGAVLPLVVTNSEDWLVANGMMSVIQTVGLLAGPAMAGFAIGLWGERVAFVVNACGYLFSAAAVMLMSVPRTIQAQAAATLRSMWDDLREGVAYLLGNRTMVGVVICMSVAFLGIGAVNVIWVPYLQRAFGVGASGLGIVDSSQGIGMVAGGLLMGYLVSRMRLTLMIALGMFFIGLMIGAMGRLPAFSLIIGSNFITGLCLMPVQSGLTTLMQLAVPDLKRGRVGSAMGAATNAAALLSMAFASLFGEKIGLSNVFLVMGVIISLAGVLGLRVLREPEKPALSEVIPAD